MKDLMRTDINLETKVEMMSQAKKDIEEGTRFFVTEEIKKKKEEFDRHFQMMIKEAEIVKINYKKCS